MLESISDAGLLDAMFISDHPRIKPVYTKLTHRLKYVWRGGLWILDNATRQFVTWQFRQFRSGRLCHAAL